MKITDLLRQDVMILDLKATEKEPAIDEMVNKLAETGCISDRETFKAGILKREAQTSTGLGDGIAMPHSKNEAVKKATVLFAKSQKGVEYEALDQQPVYLFFMIAVPAGANDMHLKALAALSRLLMEPSFTQKLKAAQTSDEVIALFEEAENEDKANQEEEAATVNTDTENDAPLVVAVTACPTGIAHTYMAEDALKKAGKELGINIRVETNGSDGVQHRLTAEEINRAAGVIVAADKQVEMARFEGKPLLNRPVSDGIRKPEELIQKAAKGDAPIYHHQGSSDAAQTATADGERLGTKLYKHLMNGVSNMLPFVIGGGIAIAISFLIDQTMGVPHDALKQLGNYHQIAHYFNEIGNAAFGFMLPILAGFIAMSIADRPGLVTGFVAGALAASGGSGFLGALVGGFLAGYIVNGLKKLFRPLPKSLEGIRTILFYPVFGILLTGAAMLLINVPMKAINTGLNDFLGSLSGTNAALLGALLAGMMSVDLGGPINKAAYVFGTGTLAATVASGGSVVMASVMAGGMVPPLAIFVATRLFKNKFNKEQKDAGLTNIVMGLSFVTEGAIPFAASDPLRVIPSFVIGSAVAGGLVGACGIKLLAPHGGIFVVFLLSRPILYLLFVVIGAVIAGIIYGILKKPIAK